MKTKFLYWLVPLIILFVAGGLIYNSPHPLQHGGYTKMHDGALIIELRNEGSRDLQLERVTVTSPKVEFGVSYSMQLVIGSGPNQGRIFEELSKQLIHPELTLNQKRDAIEKNNGTPIHYGIRIHDASDVKEVIITYLYWGIQRSKKITVR